MTPANEDKLYELMMDVRERLVAVETRIDHIDDTRLVAAKALEVAEDACEDIAEIKEQQRWSHRTVAGVVFASIANIFFAPFA